MIPTISKTTRRAVRLVALFVALNLADVPPQISIGCTAIVPIFLKVPTLTGCVITGIKTLQTCFKSYIDHCFVRLDSMTPAQSEAVREFL